MLKVTAMALVSTQAVMHLVELESSAASSLIQPCRYVGRLPALRLTELAQLPVILGI